MRRSPKVAVVTNVTPNHLDHHKDMQEYIDAKRNILLWQTPPCRAAGPVGTAPGAHAAPAARAPGRTDAGQSAVDAAHQPSGVS